MPFDKDKFAAYLTTHAAKHAQHHCAKFVRLALEAGGADTKGHPIPAKEYGRTLTRNGFRAIDVADPAKFVFAKGDVVVMEPTKRGNPAGHIAGYDGKHWVSDFIQLDFWPGAAYKKEKPSYVVYRR
ncbi:NlpC/P60 family protein [Massilia terrae]|uniref:CHAP domain-containing protein n=1 Tax=Massilia terrae TaxID=1811224 RepID=A0ABT2CYC8_9BURK|nr:CHAP domain-containing protein [Massilia terrae]MCS0658981.1 CHAP domain-containing protein [Massilia terrae]